MRVLVTGASGFIGSRFCELAGERHHEPVAFMRARQVRTRFPVAGTIVYGSLPYDVPSRAWDGVEAVVHCAAATTGQDTTESAAINVEGTRYLLEKAREQGRVRRFVFVSSQSAHENAVSSYGRTKVQAEKLVRQSGLAYAILRPGLVFGPGAQGLFARMRRFTGFPVMPIPGNKGTVQPIEVSDLCRAMLSCLELAEGESVELNLGEPEAMSLREFLQAIAVAETGRPKPALTIPLGPVKLAVGMMGKLHLPTPISSDNLQGLENVQTMETRPSLERLGLVLTPFGQAMARAVAPPEARPGVRRPLRILLIGAGKIGIVHALNLVQREATTLCAVVDRNPKAYQLYRTMGFRAPLRTDLAAALEEFAPDGAIVATPASTHYALAKLCMERNLPVLVEKPTSVSPQDLERFEQLVAAMPGRICHTGYMAAQYPHLAKAQSILAEGRLGRVRRVWASCLQSHIMASKPLRWEMIRAQSGGGVLINFAGHVISIVLRLFGLPSQTRARLWPIYSTEVEDAAELRLDYGGFETRLLACWSIPGYARPQNRIVVEAENGRLVLENFYVQVERAGEPPQIWTQLDFDVGYNAAPDYTGAGFSAEHHNFAQAIRSALGQPLKPGAAELPPPVEISEAARLERLIFGIYGQGSTELEPVAADSPWPEDQRMNQLVAGLGRR